MMTIPLPEVSATRVGHVAALLCSTAEATQCGYRAPGARRAGEDHVCSLTPSTPLVPDGMGRSPVLQRALGAGAGGDRRGEDPLGRKGLDSVRLSWDGIREAQPEIIVVARCGYPVERTLQDIPILQRSPGWIDLPAVRSGQVYVVDGSAYFSRTGPRVVDALEIMRSWPRSCTRNSFTDLSLSAVLCGCTRPLPAPLAYCKNIAPGVCDKSCLYHLTPNYTGVSNQSRASQFSPRRSRAIRAQEIDREQA